MEFLLVTSQLPGANGYTGGKVMFIDTENTFRPNRLRSIADRFNLDQDAMLGNVVFARAYTSEQQMELLDSVAAKFHEEAGIFKLLVSRLDLPSFHFFVKFYSFVFGSVIRRQKRIIC